MGARARAGAPSVIVLLIALAGSALARGQSDAEGRLTIRITGLRSEDGQVRIAVFGSEEKWLKEPVFAQVLEIEGPTVEWTIESVPYGDYAVAAFHDENENGKNDTNFFKKPKEPYGFSNNARRALGPAKWDKAKFTVANPTETTEIRVK